MVYVYHIIFIHSSVDGHLGCFCVLVIVNRVAMKMFPIGEELRMLLHHDSSQEFEAWSQGGDLALALPSGTRWLICLFQEAGTWMISCESLKRTLKIFIPITPLKLMKKWKPWEVKWLSQRDSQFLAQWYSQYTLESVINFGNHLLESTRDLNRGLLSWPLLASGQ